MRAHKFKSFSYLDTGGRESESSTLVHAGKSGIVSDPDYLVTEHLSSGGFPT